MSSLDLHTHAAYQSTLKEAIAIVCAPAQEPRSVCSASPVLMEYRSPIIFRFGIFRLTDPPGLDIIMNCKAKEAFHPHSDSSIYTVSVVPPRSCPSAENQAIRTATGHMCGWCLVCIWRLSICAEDRTFRPARGLEVHNGYLNYAPSPPKKKPGAAPYLCSSPLM